ncbi:hypothetical protein [Synechococcus sp. RedBA-s]|uniref:hypothetical protein n=1 Tax=Synechococcus sp. RedBA-s TaxID=2823741 RepID=UPI0020CC245E|nr:hypothetical protein [Synechococcus sp. RedBA-s]MCP9801888.1 hypothetical protein [Synechococcus sp. RedBA-s]
MTETKRATIYFNESVHKALRLKALPQAGQHLNWIMMLYETAWLMMQKNSSILKLTSQSKASGLAPMY